MRDDGVATPGHDDGVVRVLGSDPQVRAVMRTAVRVVRAAGGLPSSFATDLTVLGHRYRRAWERAGAAGSQPHPRQRPEDRGAVALWWVNALMVGVGALVAGAVALPGKGSPVPDDTLVAVSGVAAAVSLVAGVSLLLSSQRPRPAQETLAGVCFGAGAAVLGLGTLYRGVLLAVGRPGVLPAWWWPLVAATTITGVVLAVRHTRRGRAWERQPRRRRDPQERARLGAAELRRLTREADALAALPRDPALRRRLEEDWRRALGKDVARYVPEDALAQALAMSPVEWIVRAHLDPGRNLPGSMLKL